MVVHAKLFRREVKSRFTHEVRIYDGGNDNDELFEIFTEAILYLQSKGFSMVAVDSTYKDPMYWFVKS